MGVGGVVWGRDGRVGSVVAWMSEGWDGLRLAKVSFCSDGSVVLVVWFWPVAGGSMRSFFFFNL